MSSIKWQKNALGLLISLLSLVTVAQSELFNGCDYVYNINPGTSYLQSPYYSNYYPVGTSCRYKFVAPLDYEITVNCTIDMSKNADSCSSDYFYLARDGDSLLRDSEQFCGQGQFVRKSLFEKVVLAYVSYSSGGYGRFTCSLTATPQPCDCGWSVNTRIVNGVEAGINEYPSMAALHDTTSSAYSYCDATIISRRYLVTATHCARVQSNPANIVAYVGDHNLASNTETRYAAQYTINQIIEYPGYQSDPVTNDITLLKTNQNIEYSRGVGPICLPPPTSVNDDFAYNNVDVLGWGTVSFGGPQATKLQKITVMVPANSDCQQSYQGVTTISSSQICTYDYTGNSRDSCQYDSGGPVILRRTRQFLVGIISFGKICGEGGYAMGVNTRITSYLSWIRQTTGYTTCVVALG